ncbi:hypothetical protein HY008_00940, partial [Candidatus Woesebacteria bacterium]|nr:hypothetical protein [Candidatus Woesebacteria bacterium]
MKPEFFEFKTKDGLSLPGLLYRTNSNKEVVIFLHGNGSSSVFYDEVEENKPIAEALAKKGVSYFPFNNRGAHIIKKLNISKNGKTDRKRFGMAYERIKECAKDIDGAINFLKKL